MRSDGTPAARASVDVVPADLPAGERPDSFTTSRSGGTDETRTGRATADFVNHVKSPRPMSGGTVTFTNCMNSNSSSQGSPASENRSVGMRSDHARLRLL